MNFESKRVSGPLMLSGNSPRPYAGTLALFPKDKSIHFIGVGGIGMSGLAVILHERGFTVNGCDARASSGARKLQNKGIPVSIGHDPSHLTPDVGLAVFSSAVSMSEPELLEARAKGIPTITRGQLLADIANQDHLVGVAGAHGKTTTSGMASQLLVQAGWDPTIVVGGYVHSLGSNARSGHGRFLVAETDESDGSFLLLNPDIAIVTNIDREHLNHYKTFDNLILAFEQFVSQIRPGGVLIRCEDDPIIREALSFHNQITYGISQQADVTIKSIRQCGWGSEFSARYKGQRLGKFRLNIPGRHNVTNALAVISLGIALDLPLEVIREALWAFRGTWRRFQVVQLPNDVWFVDDYAHHPSEIQATLTADPFIGRHRVVVFQPHRFSRTKLLEQEFSRCFERADGLIITDIYSAFESPIPGVSGERVASLIRDTGHPCVRYVPRKELGEYLQHAIQPQDTVFFLGAGDISELCHDLATKLRA
jgi:UDP-N-acetylmuramate--alanine ligase